MFHLRPIGTERDDFLYRAYPKDWTVARKPKIGPPKVKKKNAMVGLTRYVRNFLINCFWGIICGGSRCRERARRQVFVCAKTRRYVLWRRFGTCMFVLS